MNAPEQIVDRTSYIGGSDAAAILGVSKWKTPLLCYRFKTGEEVEQIDPDKAKIFRRGKRMEPVAIDMLIEDFGVKVTKRSTPQDQNRYSDPEHSFLRAEVDFEFEVTAELVASFPEGFINPDLIGTIQNGEIKSVDPLVFMRSDLGEQPQWGEEFTEDVPIDYAAQSTHGLMVTGRKLCLYGTLVGYNMLIYKIERDDEIIAGMRAKEVSFWFDHVLPRIPPEPVNMEDIKILFKKFNGRPVELTTEAYEDLANLQALRENIKTLDSNKDELEFKVAKFICNQWGLPEPVVERVNGNPTVVVQAEDNAELRYGGRVVATWKKQRGAHLDQKRLKADKPEVTATYTVEHWFRALRFKKS